MFSSAVTAPLRLNLLVTDIGLIVDWLVTSISLFPAEWLFKDYANPILQTWNWSFAPLDLRASAVGLYGLYLDRLEKNRSRLPLVIALSLTFCAGLMAISFWALRKDFDLTWWISNLYFIIWPLFFIPYLHFHEHKAVLRDCKKCA